MKTRFAHIQINIRPENLPFYRDLASYLELSTIYDGDGMLGVGLPDSSSVWFVGEANDAKNDHDGVGMNHFSFGAPSQADVDAAGEHFTDKGIQLLFETPRHRPEFADGEGETYYQIMFESPDHLLFEIVYTGPK